MMVEMTGDDFEGDDNDDRNVNSDDNNKYVNHALDSDDERMEANDTIDLSR